MFGAIFRLFRKAFIMQPYLVTIDTTNRNLKRHAEDREGNRITIEPALSANTIHNFYIIMANNEEEARRIVAGTFRSRPKIMNEVYEVAQVTPLDRIVKSLSARMNAWSYIPLNKSIRLPGQQYSPVPIFTDGKESHRELQLPTVVTPVIDEDIKPKVEDITPEDKKVLTAAPVSMPTNMPANMTPEMMQMMMTMMQQMMNAQKPPLPTVSRNADEDTRKRIQENLQATRDGINQKVAGFNVPDDVVNAQSEILPDDPEEIERARAELYKNRSAAPKSIPRTAGMSDEDILNAAP